MRKLALVLALTLVVGLAAAQTQVRWFVGLGAGTDEAVIPPQQALVDAFNASQNEIELILEIVDNDQAYDILATQIAAGNAPDIVGPVGIRGRADFPGAWRDLSDLIAASDYDLSDFDPALVAFYDIEGEGQIGLPFAVFPSYLTYNVGALRRGRRRLPAQPSTANPT
jgi:multiple sugar transport system substrate-binding protein